jgi:hypothetical protein
MKLAGVSPLGRDTGLMFLGSVRDSPEGGASPIGARSAAIASRQKEVAARQVAQGPVIIAQVGSKRIKPAIPLLRRAL